MIYGKVLKLFKEFGLDASTIVIDEERYMEKFDCSLGGNKISMDTIEILENYGNLFDRNDTISEIKIGTIGADFLDNRITMIDFKNKQIQLYSERPKWMNDFLPTFKPFDFQGRRFMLLANIDGKKSELFYDYGSSSFGLITSKSRYDKYTDKNIEEISYNANRFGEPMPTHRKYSDKK
ncbi:MAG: hypothetical protein ACI94Y_001139 [Maribacter sp.]|jgi:hypothetical protein